MKAQTHIPSLLASLLFSLGAVFGLGLAVLMGVVALTTFLTGGEVDASQTIVLAVAGFEGLVLLSAAVVSVQKVLQQPSAEEEASFTITTRQIAALVILVGIAVLIGHLVTTNGMVNWIILPLLTLAAVSLPILILLGLGIRKLPLGARWQSWNVLGIAMTLAPFLLIVIESLVMIFIVVLAVVIIASQPELAREMERLSRQLYFIGPNPEAMARQLAPLLTRPGVIGVALTYFAVIVPLLEELIKPLGVWLFANRLSSPAQGFALGALSGAGYALIETLGVSAQTAEWASLLLSRIGTGILHITASALMGGAIAYAVRERRYFRLFRTYLASVSLHGLWNTLAILYTFSTLTEYTEQQGFLAGLQLPVSIGMGILAVAMLGILTLSNRRMSSTIPQEPSEQLL
jgi:hypothetical protein